MNRIDRIGYDAGATRLETAGYDGYYTMAFGSLHDKLAARELFQGLPLM